MAQNTWLSLVSLFVFTPLEVEFFHPAFNWYQIFGWLVEIVRSSIPSASVSTAPSKHSHDAEPFKVQVVSGRYVGRPSLLLLPLHLAFIMATLRENPGLKVKLLVGYM